jgi:hypothetical protein
LHFYSIQNCYFVHQECISYKKRDFFKDVAISQNWVDYLLFNCRYKWEKLSDKNNCINIFFLLSFNLRKLSSSRLSRIRQIVQLLFNVSSYSSTSFSTANFSSTDDNGEPTIFLLLIFLLHKL